MTPNEYQKEAMRTAGEHSPMDLLVNGVMGLAGESGECVDMVKKMLFQGHNLDREHLAKELGDVAWYMAVTAHAIDYPLEDVAWYMAVTAHAIDYPLEDVLLMNVEKLRGRYPDGFDPERSRNRKAGDV